MDLTKLSAAKLWLISSPPSPLSKPDDVSPRDLPYLSTALYALVPIAAPDVPTMSVDERWRLYVNPGWYATAAVPELGRELAHLTWHLLADHADRARNLDVDSQSAPHWKSASDASVAATLAPDRLRPVDLPDHASLGLRPALSAEEHFALLSALPPAEDDGPGLLGPTDGCGSGADGVPRSHELPPDAET